MIASGDPVRAIRPASLPVTLAELKAQARVSFTDEDAIMMGHLRAAVELCENYVGMGFITQTWAQTFVSFPTTASRTFILGRRPVQSVTQISYLDTSGVDQTLDPTLYLLAGAGWEYRPSSIWQSSAGVAWPSALDFAGAVTVTYVVGYGDNQNDVPELIRQAILMAAASFYSYREDITTERVPAEIPISSRALLRDWRPEPVV